MTKRTRYEQALSDLSHILDAEGGPRLDDIAVMSTINSILKQMFDSFYWVGFYRVCGNHLVVGPYIGTLGCLEIEIGRGVCGRAAADRKTVIVPDVTAFPGHIACDARSKSEIVVPVFGPQGELLAVLDVDSDQAAAFDEVDQRGLESICAIFRTAGVTQQQLALEN